MIKRCFEPFTLLEKTVEADGLGGMNVSLSPVLGFQGALCMSPAARQTMAGQEIRAETLTLLYEFDVTLKPGEYVRREVDGALYRLIGPAGGVRSPAFSGLQFAQIPVERLVIPC